MRKGFILLVFLLICSFIIVGCGNSTTGSETPAATTTQPVTATTTTTQPVTGTPKYGGTFRFMESRAPGNAIGWFHDAGMTTSGIDHIIDTLFNSDRNNNKVPRLGTRIEVASDMKSITIELRQGVKFHDGSDFNAEVVKWNLEMYKVGKSNPYTNITSIDIIDDHNIKINFENYQNLFFDSIAGTRIVSKQAYETHGKEWMRWNPVGTGPFKFESYVKETSIKATKFENYWREGLPYLDAVQVDFVVDPLTMSAAFQTDEYDMMTGDLSSVYYDTMQAGDYKLDTMYAGVCLLIYDSKNADSPWGNLKVRQAAEYAINREAIVNARGFGFWEPIYQYAVPGTTTYQDDFPKRTYDPDKAKQLLTEAGYPTGFKTTIFGNVSTLDKEAMIAIQSNLKAVGIDAELQLMDIAGHNSARAKEWHNGIMLGLYSFDANPNASYNRYFTKTSVNHPSFDKSDEIEQLFQDSVNAKEYDPVLMQKINRYVFDKALYTTVWATPRGALYKPYVHDHGFYSYGHWATWDAHNTWLSK